MKQLDSRLKIKDHRAISTRKKDMYTTLILCSASSMVFMQIPSRLRRPAKLYVHVGFNKMRGQKER